MLPIKDDAGTPAAKPVELTANQCWDYIRQAAIGRLAVIADQHPEIFPINFVVDRGIRCFPHRRRNQARARPSKALPWLSKWTDMMTGSVSPGALC